MYDVIVIGAGPAGSTAAKVLAENGLKVLLAEKFEMPRYKSCSGQLIKKSIDLVMKYYGEAVPRSVMCTPTVNKGMLFTDHKGNTQCFGQDGLNIWRSSFDKWLADMASKSGAEVRDKTAVLSCEEHGEAVTVTMKGNASYTEEARYVIDCEGAAGSLKRRLLKQAPHLIYTYQTFNQGTIDLDHQYFHAYLQLELSEYDAWFNVKDEQLVLGVSVKDISRAEYYYERFISFMKENHGLRIEQQLKIDKQAMPHILPDCNIDYGTGRIFFAGEIAGFLNPMGEGISAGLESGYCVANAIVDNFDDLGRIYSDYINHAESLHDYMKRQWSLVGEMAGNLWREYIL